VLTTNLAFSEWPRIFPSATSAIALIDRIEAEEAKRKPRRKGP
jgi:DNA replication protein DnaC